MPRFFLPRALCEENLPSLTVTGDDAHHIGFSLRMAVGDRLTVSDGEGTDHLCVIEAISPSEVRLHCESSVPTESEPPYHVTLYQAMPKGDKADEIVQKAVELGCTRIVFFLSDFCVSRPDSHKWAHKQPRLQRIALEAAKQCGRGRLPAVCELLSFSEMCEQLSSYPFVIFCSEHEKSRTLARALPECAPDSLAVIVGSEGGFSPKEAEAIAEKGALPVSLGARILRCETAPLYALSALSARYEL